jgi:DNA-binding winged helix-turn-helix (wHTH) protein
MKGIQNEDTWQTLPNPFSVLDTSEIIKSHVSGRSTDITEIITGGQSAIILAGAPNIGKTALIRYLQRSPDSVRSWRDELTALPDQLNPDEIHFVQINLTPLEGIDQKERLLTEFADQCVIALKRVFTLDRFQSSVDSGVRGLRELLRNMSRETPTARYFLMLDAIERLAWPDLPTFPLKSKAQTNQERALALLDHCGAISTLVDLIDEFRIFGVIISIGSLPRPKIDDQFIHVSADLARFRTITLQTFTWNDSIKFLAQSPEDFGTNWASMFKMLGGNYIFSSAEQEWLIEQAGTHPYLIQQFCFHAFHFKQQFAHMHGSWSDLQIIDKDQLVERITGLLNTFLTSIWKRLREAIDNSTVETRSKFKEFVSLLSQKEAGKVIDFEFWDQLGVELRYVLSSEGILRYDLFQPIHFPGATLSRYLAQKANEIIVKQPSSLAGRYLVIRQPGNIPLQLSLSELEYRLLKTLSQHPNHCTEEELMRGAWGNKINRPVFTQRMHQLRKKLRDHTDSDFIENRYGGIYSLNKPEQLYLE